METNEEGEWEEGEEWGVTMTLTISMQVCDEPSWESACEYLKREVFLQVGFYYFYHLIFLPHTN